MEESWRVSASLPLPLVPLRALVGGERVTASSESRSAGYSYRRSALPDLITAGGAHPHIQTPFTQDLNKGNNENILKKGMVLLPDLSSFTWSYWLMSVEVSEIACGLGCLNTNLWCPNRYYLLTFFFSISSKYLIHE